MLTVMTDTARLGSSCVDSFRELMSCFPSGVTVITTCDRDGSPRGLTCTSLCSVSMRPPMLLACVANHSDTLAVLLRNGAFAVNLLHAGGRDAAQVFASPIPDRFRLVNWARTPACGLPWLRSDAHAVAECLVTDAVPAGDHTVVFGVVDSVVAAPDRPLLYGLRQYAAWAPSE